MHFRFLQFKLSKIIFETNQINQTIKIQNMNRQRKSDYIHRHVHHHYHYDINEESPVSLENIHPASKKSPRHSHLLQQYSSWKNHINPQVTRLYQQISDSESVQETRAPHIPYNHKKLARDSYCPQSENHEFNYLRQSRTQLAHNIEKYEQYLKTRQGSQLQVPNTVSFLKLEYPEYDQDEKYLSVKKVNIQRKSLEDIIRKKADSKIFYADKMYEASTARGEEKQSCRGSYIMMGRDSTMHNMVARSEIKSPKNHFGFQNTKLGLSEIKQNKTEPYSHEQAHNFSLFQRQVEQESFNDDKQPMYSNIYQQETNQLVTEGQQSQYFNKNYDSLNSSYKYQLMKEECEFLRNKFIEHVGIIHGVKF